MQHDDELLILLLEGRLSVDDRRTIDQRLEREPELADRFNRLQQLHGVLSSSAHESFAPMFSTRLMQRLAATVEQAASIFLYESLRWFFVRAAAVGLLAAVVLGADNLGEYGKLGLASSSIEALFGLPSTSLIDALSVTELSPPAQAD